MRSAFIRRVVYTFWIAACGAAACADESGSKPAFGKIERKDARLDALLPSDAKLEKLADGFEWSEGPAWNRKASYLLFSDIPRNSVMRWQSEQGISLFLKPSGYTGQGSWGKEPGSNGLVYDRQNQLVLCQHGDRRIARLEKDGSFKSLADRYQGKRFNSPNDAVFNSKGDLYFTDPPYGLPQGFDDPHRELDFCGVYRLAPDGTVTLLNREMTRPNGIGLSPDEKKLYVAQSDPKAALWNVFDVQGDGTLGKPRVFGDVTSLVDRLPGLPDGLKVDHQGNVFATAPGGVHVYAPDATLLGIIHTGERTANCAFGGDGSELFICADMYLCRIKTSTRGIGPAAPVSGKR